MALDNYQATTFPTPLTSAVDLLQGNAQGYAILANGTGAAPTTANVFEHGCLYYRIDSGTGSAGVYQNTGSRAVPAWTLLDTALPGDTASSLVDSNNVTTLAINTTASAVNGFMITNSATGAVGANAVIFQPGAPSGSDAAISLTLNAKGATGILTLGEVTTTGAINVGVATTAATAAVNVLSAAGTASTQTITIGGGTSTTSGGKVVNIATGIPGAGTTNTVAIGTAGTTTGTVGVTIGSVGNAAHTTLIQGGSGTGAITLTPQTTGTIVVGAAAGTGAITVGSSSTTQTLNLGTGAGVATINVGTGAAANVIKVGAAASLITHYGTVSQSLDTNRVTAGGSNNAITGTLTDAGGTAIATATGLRITVVMGALTLQAGANTLNLNSTSAVAIKKASAPTVDLAVARAANSIVELVFNGTSWLALSE